MYFFSDNKISLNSV